MAAAGKRSKRSVTGASPFFAASTTTTTTTTTTATTTIEGDPLRSACQASVAALCTGWSEGLPGRPPVSTAAVAALAELLAETAKQVSIDAELFALHAGRKTITPDDLLLCARKTPELQEHLTRFREASAQSAPARSRRRTD